MWEPQPLTTLWAFTACYRDSFTFFIVARQRRRQNPPTVAMQRLGKNVTAATNAKTTIEELLDVSFSMRSVSYQGKRRLVLPRTCLYFKNYKETKTIRSLNMHVCQRYVTLHHFGIPHSMALRPRISWPPPYKYVKKR
jgi:hypothetical protein